MDLQLMLVARLKDGPSSRRFSFLLPSHQRGWPIFFSGLDMWVWVKLKPPGIGPQVLVHSI